MALLLSLTFAVGILLVFLGLTPRRRPSLSQYEERPTHLSQLLREAAGDGFRLRDFVAASLVAGFIVAGGVQVTFGWPVVTAVAFAIGLMLPAWYYRARRERQRAELEEAVAEAVDALRDAVRIGLGIEEAIRALARRGPEALRPVLLELERDARLVGFEQALRNAQQRAADPVFDAFAVALVMAYRIGGRNLATVFDGLSRSIRGTVQARREVRAEQAKNVLSARVIATLPLLLILSIRASNPDYLTAFSTAGGQLTLALCLVSVSVGYAAMLRATSLPEDGRVLQ